MTDHEAKIDQLKRAYDRAVKNSLAVFRISDTHFEVPSSSNPGVVYTVRVHGPRPVDLLCTCPAANHFVCQHRAAVIAARKYRVSAEVTEIPGVAQTRMDF